ncbi:MAG TPA: hypothetical protein DHM90_07325 [Clostridiaceae bacterium]|nr:hypothetical protein [Clostridiaceae bacterium]
MNTGKKIQKLRKENNLSQEQLAEKFGVSRQSVSKWESDQSVPDIYNIIQLSNLFGVSTDYFLKDSETMNEQNPISRKRSQPLFRHCTLILSLGLVLSLLVSMMLFVGLKNSEKDTQEALNGIHKEYYVNLNSYNEILKTVARQELSSQMMIKEAEKMKNHVDALIHTSSQYILLTQRSGDPIGAYLWDMATSARWINREYFLEENGIDTKEEIRNIDADRISKVTEILDEIIYLEKSAGTDAEGTEKRFTSTEMAEALQPKLKDLTELTILSFPQNGN